MSLKLIILFFLSFSLTFLLSFLFVFVVFFIFFYSFRSFVWTFRTSSFLFYSSFVLHLNPSVCIYPTPPPKSGCDTRSVLKQGSAGLNSEFSFSKAKEPCLSYYLSTAGWGEGQLIDTGFSQKHLCKLKHNQLCARIELVSSVPFPTPISITLNTTPWFSGVP